MAGARGLRGAFDFRLSAGPQLHGVEDYRRAARRALPIGPWAYVDGGAQDMLTLRENRAAFERWSLRARTLAGHATRDLSVEVAGERLELPILLAPTGTTGMAHWEGELGAARAAESRGTRLVLSSAASYSIEEVAEGTRETHMFQLYPWRDRDLMSSLVGRARRSGYRTLFVTVDVPVTSNREYERRHGMAVPPILTPARILDAAVRPRWWYGFVKHQRVSMRNLVDDVGANYGVRSARLHANLLQADLNWDDLAWLREQWQGPFYVKGILDPDDAARCVELGADGVVVSNHGGRQLDGCLASLDALPPVVERIGGRAQILLDSGVRRGGDVIKALCLGADAVLVGRPFVYGLAVGGQEGVAGVLDLLRAEIDRDLLLMGCSSVRDLDRSWVIPAPGSRQVAAALTEV